MSNYDVLNSKWDVELSVATERLNASLAEMRELEVSSEGFIEKITGVFGNAFNAMRLSINKFTQGEQKALALNEVAISKMTASAMSKNYVYLTERPVSVPAGLNGPMLPYVLKSQEVAESVRDTMAVIIQLRSDIGRVVSTEGGLRDSSLFSEASYVKKQKDMKKRMLELGKMRTGDEYTAERPYGSVFRNNSELTSSFGAARVSNEIYNAIDRRKVIAEIETTMQYIRELNGVAKMNGFSKPLIDKIGVAVACTAELVEAFSAGVFNQEMIVKSLNNVAEEISELM